ncbi:MAG: hypothetical protein ACYC6Y_12390 [Thermoguttaceae bacterium]
MVHEIMHREASDNAYLHKDFHGALSAGIEYLHETYGEEAVRQYLWQLARSYYAPLTASLAERGLLALEEHFRKLYELEGGVVRIERTDDELRIEVEACPAVTHMREHGYAVARLFRETTGTVNRAICEGTPFAAELVEYDESTGRSVQRFSRSSP